MLAIRGLLSLLARLSIAAIFLLAAFGKVMTFSGTVERMAAEGVPSPQIMLAGAIAFLIIGGLSIVLGWGFSGRLGALLLLCFLAAATYYFHDFWKMPPDTPAETRQEEIIQFMKNVALMGTMLFLLANGTGPWSLGGRGRAADEQPAADDD